MWSRRRAAAKPDKQPEHLRCTDIRLSVYPGRRMKIPGFTPRTAVPLLHRLIAVGGIVLVLLLAVLAASPQLHAWLHGDAGEADHECAVTLFQHGADAVVEVLAVAATAWTVVALVVVPPTAPDLHQRRYWLPPGNAPPALN